MTCPIGTCDACGEDRPRETLTPLMVTPVTHSSPAEFDDVCDECRRDIWLAEYTKWDTHPEV